MLQQLEGVTARLKKNISKLERDNLNLERHATIGKNLEFFKSGQSFSLMEILEGKSDHEQVSCLIPMISHLREKMQNVEKRSKVVELEANQKLKQLRVKVQELKNDVR